MGYKTILVAIDPETQNLNAYNKALDLATDDSKIILFSCIEPLDKGPVELNTTFYADELYTKTEEVLENLAEKANKDVDIRIGFGNPKQLLLNVITDDNVDIVVINHSDKNALERILLGSVTNHIVNHANTDILIVR
jgi:universal stress protein uspA